MKETLSFKEAVLWWGSFLIIIIAFLVLVKEILFPFIVAIFLAYILNPLMDSLSKRHMSRFSAALLIVTCFYVFAVLISGLIFPVLYQQTLTFLESAPGYLQDFQTRILPFIEDSIGNLDPHAAERVKNAGANMTSALFNILLTFFKNLWHSGVAFINVLSLIFITPIVTFYMLRDWHGFVKKVKSWFPKRHAKTILAQAKLIDKTLSGYLRGQVNVILILAIFYATALSLAGLRFGLIIGFATGILSFIPFLGVLTGFVIGTILAYIQFGTVMHVAIIAAIFMIGQVIEGNFITPKLVGDRVGLHPVWIIFGMLAGAALFGFTGVLLAVPVTAVLGVCMRFAIDQYLTSKFYKH